MPAGIPVALLRRARRRGAPGGRVPGRRTWPRSLAGAPGRFAIAGQCERGGVVAARHTAQPVCQSPMGRGAGSALELSGPRVVVGGVYELGSANSSAPPTPSGWRGR